jgi:hypothetical protein
VHRIGCHNLCDFGYGGQLFQPAPDKHTVGADNPNFFNPFGNQLLGQFHDRVAGGDLVIVNQGFFTAF